MNRRKPSVSPRRFGKHRIPRWGVIVAAAAVSILVAVGAATWFLQGAFLEVASAHSSASASVAVHYVGTEACASCHTKEGSEWLQSQHHDAMAEATEATVLADFNGTTFTGAGVTSTFFQRDGKFYTNSPGPDGQLHDYQIKYTYGLFPLQQYLMEFPDGRLQPFPIAWDTRSLEQGGQRWFDLYPDEHTAHNDEFFWTRPAQNWNFMCADCHSTQLRKNYDAASDTFKTTWSEINVGCEACHGPGSGHMEWVRLKNAGKPIDHYDNNGLIAYLNERKGVSWTNDPKTGNPVRSKPRETDNEIQVCAQCHSRRAQIAEGYQAGKPFLDYYRPALVTPPLYYADGQQHDEVYKWASFLQSKMYAKGVTCSDCHNAHTGKLRSDGNTVCATCHLPSKYDTEQHSNHKTGSDGAQCTACHMPTTNYMVVDPRQDHSFRVPRPDQSVKFDVPNACNQCHTERSASWAADQVKEWYGHDPQGFQHFAPAFFASQMGASDAQSQLQTVAADPAQPAIVRATALSQLDPESSGALPILAQGLRDPSGIVRLGALQSMKDTLPEVFVSQVVPLLSDPLRAVRVEAADVLASAPWAQLDVVARTAFEKTASEYVFSQQYNADRAESRVNLAAFYAKQGEVQKAEEEMKSVLRFNPLFVPAYVNLADLLRATNRDADGELILRQGLQALPNNADLHYALGLTLVRARQSDAAIGELEQATVLAPGNARFAYVYAVALHSKGKTVAAIAILEKAILADPENRNILEALVSLHTARGEHALADKYMTRLQGLSSNGQSR